jgi:hypothetical protein
MINRKESTTDKLISLITTLATRLDNIEEKLENLPNQLLRVHQMIQQIQSTRLL